jgi:adenylate cyclase
MTINDNDAQGKPRERRLAAIMLTDIVGYSRIMSDDEGAALRILDRHNSILLPIIAAHGGRVLKTMGDAILAEFQSVVQAVKCALTVQSELHANNETLPAEQRFEVRIGIHVGDVVITDDDMFGDGVNIAARIQPLAEPGGVCISSVVHNQIKNMPEFMSVSLGKKHLKNIPEAVEVLRIHPASGRLIRRTEGGKLKFILIAAAVVVALAAAGAFLTRSRATHPAPDEEEQEAYLVKSPTAALSEAKKCSERVAEFSAQGKTGQAVMEIEAALEFFPEVPDEEWAPQEAALARPIFEEWSVYLKGVVQREPGLYAARRVQGKLLFRQGDLALAFSTLDSACSLGDKASCDFVREKTVMDDE